MCDKSVIKNQGIVIKLLTHNSKLITKTKWNENE